MPILRNFNGVSAFFFFFLGFYYIALFFMFRNGFYTDFILTLMRVSDIPFALAALTYGGTHLALQFEAEDQEAGSLWGVIVMAVCLLLFGAVVFVNFALPVTH